MRKFKLILKGVLLWTTAFAAIFYTLCIEQLMEMSYLNALLPFLPISSLCYICYKTISEDELEIITLAKYFGINLKED